IDANLPAVRLVKTSEHLHQSRFAGAVFSRQGNDFTVADVQVYGIERDDSGESFADSLHFEHGLTHPNASTTATKPIDLSSELRHIALLDNERWNDLLLVRWNHGRIAAKRFRHQKYGLVAKLIRLLDNCCKNGSVFDSSQCFVFFIKTDDLDLPDL